MLQATKAIAHGVEQAQIGVLVVLKCMLVKRFVYLVRQCNDPLQNLGPRVVGLSSSGILHLLSNEAGTDAQAAHVLCFLSDDRTRSRDM